MIYIRSISDGVAKAYAENEPYIYKKGQTIWTQLYSHEEHRFIRVPWWIVHKARKTKKGQSLTLLSYTRYGLGVNK